ncbi:hypothetical protein ACX928_11150 [Enterobacter roggenkampii]|uniref:hypothetical protein n=1 Tax=Citrobacter freundii TaxID=546 RepID=UPI00227B4F7D|nr:hypothetical protein [Citrobacter freundii]MCY3452797.1 hypothetical protein [Citrobacter freundii]
MKLEMIVGLLFFSIAVISLIQLLIRMHCKKVRQKREKALAEFKARREEVERKARRQL